MIEKGKKILRAPYLKAGDKVALVSPAYWVPEEAIIQAANVLRSWGLQPVIGPHTISLNVDAFSGTADERAADLLWALEDDTIKAIFCSRGGYGSMHLLNRIPLEIFRQHPKWLIGHGDITMLLYAVATTGTLCIHGPMGFQIASQQEPTSTITRNLLMGILPHYMIPCNPYNRFGHADAVEIGQPNYSKTINLILNVPSSDFLNNYNNCSNSGQFTVNSLILPFIKVCIVCLT